MNEITLRGKILEISKEILMNKTKRVNYCEKCPLNKNLKNIPELGALSGLDSWMLGLLDGNIRSLIMVILTPSGRHYMTGAPELPNKKWLEVAENIYKFIKDDIIERASTALPLAFEIRISEPTSWPKGGWFYYFIDKMCKKLKSTAYFTRIIKCGIRDLRENDTLKAQELCSNYLLEEIKKLEPDIIITIGNDAFQFFKNLIREKNAFLLDAYSGIYSKKVSKSFAFDEGIVKIHSNGYRFKIKIKNVKELWLLPLLHPEFFLSYFDSFVKIIRMLMNYDYPEFPLGDYFDDIKHVLSTGPAAVYLYPLWTNLKQLIEGE